jgi:hypothetical protein
VLPTTVGTPCVSPVGFFTAGTSVDGRFGGGAGAGEGAALGLAPAVALAVGFAGAGARVIGFVGARPVAGFAPGSCRTGAFAEAAGLGGRLPSAAAPPFERNDAITIACGDSSPQTPQKRDSPGTSDPQPRQGASVSIAWLEMRSRTPHLAQKLSSG